MLLAGEVMTHVTFHERVTFSHNKQSYSSTGTIVWKEVSKCIDGQFRSSGKNVWKSDRCWEPVKFSKLSSYLVVQLSSCLVVKFDPWDMLNNFCFHVYAQKCQVVRLSSCKEVKLSSFVYTTTVLMKTVKQSNAIN